MLNFKKNKIHGFHKRASLADSYTKGFSKINSIKGWFNIDDYHHFHLILSLQNNLGVKGDLLEIGTYFGRSACMMASMLKDDQKIFLCDAFLTDTEDNYSEKPTETDLLKNLKEVLPQLNLDSVLIKNCLSTNLKLSPEQTFRFIHIDGGHQFEQVLFDLKLSDSHLVINGVIAIDDYEHIDWPGVTRGVNTFLKEHHSYKILADLNRFNAIGRKLYLIKK